MNLEEDLDYTYKLIVDNFNINFKKPVILDTKQYANKFFKINSLRSLLFYIDAALFDDETNGIFIPEPIILKNRSERIYKLLHENAHSLSCQLNKEFLTKRMEVLEKENKDKWFTYLSFQEGIADYIAIECCKKTGNPSIIEFGNNRERRLKNSLFEWKYNGNIEIMSLVYKIDLSKWQEIFIEYVKRNIDAAFPYSYDIGYYFISRTDVDSLEKVIKNPPISLKEVLYPESYKIQNNSN